MQKDATRLDHASSRLLSSSAAWIKSKIIPISEASIPLNDWELTYSNITYDVAPVKDGAFFRLNDYLERFFASIDANHLDPKMTKQEIKDALAAMVGASGLIVNNVSRINDDSICGQYTESVREMYWQWFAQDQYRTMIDYSANASKE